MPTYCVSRYSHPDWNSIPVLQMQHTGWLRPCTVTAKAQAYHDDDKLYIHMEATEPNIRAAVVDPLGQVCEDSCLEFFFAPMADDFRYFNFEFNPLGTMYLGFGGPRETRVRQFPGDRKQFCISPFYTENEWGVTFEIPETFIKMYFPQFSFRGVSACNFYKCGDKTQIPHYLSWSPMKCDRPDFHRRWDFGELTFE